MLNWLLTPGQAGDCPQAARLLGPHLAPACEVVADTAYDSDGLRGLIAAAGALAVIPTNPRRRNLMHFDPCAYANRHHLEQTVNKLKRRWSKAGWFRHLTLILDILFFVSGSIKEVFIRTRK